MTIRDPFPFCSKFSTRNELSMRYSNSLLLFATWQHYNANGIKQTCLLVLVFCLKFLLSKKGATFKARTGGGSSCICEPGLMASLAVFGHNIWSVYSNELNSVVVTTPPVSQSLLNQPLRISFLLNDGLPLHTSHTFVYRTDPTFNNIEPRNHLIVCVT